MFRANNNKKPTEQKGHKNRMTSGAESFWRGFSLQNSFSQVMSTDVFEGTLHSLNGFRGFGVSSCIFLTSIFEIWSDENFPIA